MNTGKLRQPGSLVDDSLGCQTYPPGRILMVDDDPGLCASNAEALRRHGYHVTTAGDGEAGWEELQIHRYHLLITANTLPGLSGVGLVKKLRSACMPLPVIMVIEALPAWESPQYSWLLKATKLLKPYSIADLLSLVKQVLRPTADVREQARARPHWQNPPPTEGLRR